MKKNSLVVSFLVSVFMLSLCCVSGFCDEAGIKKFEYYMKKQVETTKKGYSVDSYLNDNTSNITKISKKGYMSKFSYSDGRIVITDNQGEKPSIVQYLREYDGWVKVDYTTKGKGVRYARANTEVKSKSKRNEKKVNDADFSKTLEDLTKYYDDIKYLKDENVNGYNCAVFVLSPIKEYEGVYDKGEIVYIMKSTGIEIRTKGTDGYIMNNINVKVGLKDSEFEIPEGTVIYGNIKELVKNNINISNSKK